MLAMSAAVVGGVTVRLGAGGAILDTGTTLITCSDADARAINSVRACWAVLLWKESAVHYLLRSITHCSDPRAVMSLVW